MGNIFASLLEKWIDIKFQVSLVKRLWVSGIVFLATIIVSCSVLPSKPDTQAPNQSISAGGDIIGPSYQVGGDFISVPLIEATQMAVLIQTNSDLAALLAELTSSGILADSIGTPSAAEQIILSQSTVIALRATLTTEPRFHLIQPRKSSCYDGHLIHFKWDWLKALEDVGNYGGEYFALQVALEGQQNPPSIVWTKDSEYILDTTAGLYPLKPGNSYVWNVAVVRPYADPTYKNWELIDLSPPQTFTYTCTPVVSTPTPVFGATADAGSGSAGGNGTIGITPMIGITPITSTATSTPVTPYPPPIVTFTPMTSYPQPASTETSTPEPYNSG